MTRLAEITEQDREYVKAKIARAVERKLLPKGRLGRDGRRTRLAEPKATKKLKRIEADRELSVGDTAIGSEGKTEVRRSDDRT